MITKTSKLTITTATVATSSTYLQSYTFGLHYSLFNYIAGGAILFLVNNGYYYPNKLYYGWSTLRENRF